MQWHRRTFSHEGRRKLMAYPLSFVFVHDCRFPFFRSPFSFSSRKFTSVSFSFSSRQLPCQDFQFLCSAFGLLGVNKLTQVHTRAHTKLHKTYVCMLNARERKKKANEGSRTSTKHARAHHTHTISFSLSLTHTHNSSTYPVGPEQDAQAALTPPPGGPACARIRAARQEPRPTSRAEQPHPPADGAARCCPSPAACP